MIGEFTIILCSCSAQSGVALTPNSTPIPASTSRSPARITKSQRICTVGAQYHGNSDLGKDRSKKLAAAGYLCFYISRTARLFHRKLVHQGDVHQEVSFNKSVSPKRAGSTSRQTMFNKEDSA